MSTFTQCWWKKLSYIPNDLLCVINSYTLYGNPSGINYIDHLEYLSAFYNYGDYLERRSTHHNIVDDARIRDIIYSITLNFKMWDSSNIPAPEKHFDENSFLLCAITQMSPRKLSQLTESDINNILIPKIAAFGQKPILYAPIYLQKKVQNKEIFSQGQKCQLLDVKMSLFQKLLIDKGTRETPNLTLFDLFNALAFIEESSMRENASVPLYFNFNVFEHKNKINLSYDAEY